MTTMTTVLRPRAPFRFEHSIRFLHGFSPMAGEQVTEDGRLRKAVRARGRTVLFSVREAPAAQDTLEVELRADGPINAALARESCDRVGFFLSIDDELEPFYARAREDEIFAPLIDRLFGFHHPKLATPFESICWAILGQRCPQKVARKMKDHLVERTGGKIEADGKIYRAFPEAAELAAAGEEAIAGAIKHRIKARRIHSAAIAFAGVDENFLRRGEVGEVHAWLSELEGIGAWSAAFVLFRGLGRTERLLGSEKQLLPAMQEIYGKKRMPDVAAFRRTAARYGDSQGYWALYAKTSCSPNIVTVEDRRTLADLGSVGKRTLEDFAQLGITNMGELARAEPRELYDRLSKITGTRQDPCVADVFSCAVAQARDPFLPEEQRKWWYWSRVRKEAR